MGWMFYDTGYWLLLILPFSLPWMMKSLNLRMWPLGAGHGANPLISQDRHPWWGFFSLCFPLSQHNVAIFFIFIFPWRLLMLYLWLQNEKARKSSRGSASPRRLSASPQSSNNFGQLISRSSSAPRCSPPPLARPVTPSRRPSTPPNKPSTPTPRSSTPTLRRMSTGSSGQASSSGRRGTSPMTASRGNSASPKLRGWQSNLPGFSSDAPPNLRTSLSDRPSPHVRGLSPTPSRRSRQSMSPTASRSASSSHSNDRDLFSSYSKGSVVSSGDDDMDTLHSVAISSSLPARRNGMSVNSRPVAFSKRPSRTSPSNSLPKRSFESVLRQMVSSSVIIYLC